MELNGIPGENQFFSSFYKKILTKSVSDTITIFLDQRNFQKI